MHICTLHTMHICTLHIMHSFRVPKSGRGRMEIVPRCPPRCEDFGGPSERCKTVELISKGFEWLASFLRARGIRISHPISYVLSAVLFACLFWLVAASVVDKTAVHPLLAGALAAALLGVPAGIGMWHWLVTPPKNPVGVLGVAIAIRPEGSEEAKRLRNDVLVTLKRDLSASTSGLNVVEIPGFLTPDITDMDSAVRLMRSARCHLLIWGGMRKRREAGRDVYVLNLEGSVAHAQIDSAKRGELQQEMRGALPARLLVNVEKELTEFQIVSSSVAISAKFIVALAAGLSSDVELCLALMKEVEATVKAAKGPLKKSWAVKQLSSRAPRLVDELLFMSSGLCLQRWSSDRTDELLATSEARLAELKKRGGETAPYLLNQAFLHAVRNELEAAEQLVFKCKARAKDDPAWRFSLAFLRMREGRYKEALVLYDEVNPSNVSNEVLISVEDFVQWWLETRHDTPGLWLLLAKFNQRFKGDRELASSDLTRLYQQVPKPDLALRTLADSLWTELHPDGPPPPSHTVTAARFEPTAGALEDSPLATASKKG